MKYGAASVTTRTSPNSTLVDDFVGRLRMGDSDALAALFSVYEDRFRRLIDVRLHWSLHGRLDASDVLQDAYLDARERLEHFFSREDSSIFVWLRLIVLQRVKLLERFHLQTSKRNASKEVCLDGNRHSGKFGDFSYALAASITSPSAAAVREESVALVDRMLASMDAIDREVLILRHFEQLANNEVADVLGVGITAASNRYVRALRRLKEMVESAQRGES